MPRNTSAICDYGRTKLSFADNSPLCSRNISGHSRGNVEKTPIGFVSDCASVQGYLPEEIIPAQCRVPARKKVCDKLC